MCLAVPGRLLEIIGDDPATRAGKVSFGGVVKEVNLACVPEAVVGNYLTVHVGFALGVVDEEEAEQVFGYLREIGELAELEKESWGADGQADAGTPTDPAEQTSASPTGADTSRGSGT